MVATTILNGVLGFAALMAILFCVGDIERAEKSPTGYPFIEIFYQATNSAAGATAMVCVILALVFFATIGLIATASRMTWAFAHDNGLPGSRWLAMVGSCFFSVSTLEPPNSGSLLNIVLSRYYRSNLTRHCHSTLSASPSLSVLCSHSLISALQQLSMLSSPSVS